MSSPTGNWSLMSNKRSVIGVTLALVGIALFVCNCSRPYAC